MAHGLVLNQSFELDWSLTDWGGNFLGGTSFQNISSIDSGSVDIISSLAADTFYVRILDAVAPDTNSCTVILADADTVFVDTAFAINPLCPLALDGEVHATAWGGDNGPYTYDWGLGASADSFRLGIGANTYTVTSFDASGCQSFNSAEATLVDPPTIILSETHQGSSSCDPLDGPLYSDGWIQINHVSGGTFNNVIQNSVSSYAGAAMVAAGGGMNAAVTTFAFDLTVL